MTSSIFIRKPSCCSSVLKFKPCAWELLPLDLLSWLRLPQLQLSCNRLFQVTFAAQTDLQQDCRRSTLTCNNSNRAATGSNQWGEFVSRTCNKMPMTSFSSSGRREYLGNPIAAGWPIMGWNLGHVMSRLKCIFMVYEAIRRCTTVYHEILDRDLSYTHSVFWNFSSLTYFSWKTLSNSDPWFVGSSHCDGTKQKHMATGLP